MGLGTFADLTNAANGQFKPRVAPAVATTPDPNSMSPYQRALYNRVQYSTTSADRMSQGLDSPVATLQPTNMYGQVLGAFTRPSTGVAGGKAKYGGFANAGDLATAVEGSAARFSSEVPTYLRGMAEQRYGQLDPMYSKAHFGAQTTVAGNAPRSARAFEEATQDRSTPLRRYASQLGDWYSKNAAPAEEALKTAQQIETTPLSNLATAIATSQYGQDPDWARAKFADLDQRSWENTRDAEYMQKYGMPYGQFQSMYSDASRQQKQRALQVEQATGMPASQITDFSGMNSDTIYNLLATPQVYYKNDKGEQVYSDSSTVIKQAMDILDTGSENEFTKYIDSIKEIEGQQQFADLVRALGGLRARKSQRNTDYFGNYAWAE